MPDLTGARRLRSVEGLRALAALLVVYYHLQRAIGYTHPGIVPSAVSTWSERLGPFGVGIFFVLSGFLLYKPFVRAALEDRAPPRLGRYYMRRFARIYPAYWVALAVAMYVVGPQQIKSITDFVVYFGLLQNYRTGSLLTGLGVAWTLVIEVSFYVVLPLLAWLMRSPARASMRSRMQRQFAGLAVLYAIGISTRAWALWVRGPGQGRIGAFQPWLTPEASLPGHLDWFALGMLLAVGSAWVEVSGARPRVLRWAQERAWPTWMIAFIAYGLVMLAPFPPLGHPLAASWSMLVNTVLPMAAFLIVAPIALAPTGKGVIRASLASVLAVSIGSISYGIYLWHLVISHQVFQWIVAGDLPRSAALHATLVVVGTAFAATLSYFVIEAPFMRWSARVGRGGLRRRQVVASVTEP